MTRGDDDESSDSDDEERVGDIAYAVGYGYNLISEPGVKSVSRCPIIALEKLKEAGNGFRRQLNGVSSSYSETYAESTIDEIITKMSIESKVITNVTTLGDDFEKMQTLLSAKGEQDYTNYLYGWDSKTGFKAEHGDYYLLFPGIAKEFLNELTGSAEIRVDYDKDQKFLGKMTRIFWEMTIFANKNQRNGKCCKKRT